MARRQIWNLPVIQLTLSELYEERDELRTLRSIHREMTVRDGGNKHREIYMRDAMCRLILVEAQIEAILSGEDSNKEV